MATALGEFFYEGLIQNEKFMTLISKENWTIVPVPLSQQIKKRGYNQAEILGKDVGKRFNIHVINLLKRIKNTKTQVGLKVEDRRKNIKNAFTPIQNREFKIQNSNIFLVTMW